MFCFNDNHVTLFFITVTKSPCQKERQRYLGWNSQSSANFVPECADDGRYKPVQCNSSHCWCVDSHGYELPETQRLKNTDLDCSKVPGIEMERVFRF